VHTGRSEHSSRVFDVQLKLRLHFQPPQDKRQYLKIPIVPVARHHPVCQAERVPNNQLALLSMVDCWWKLGLNPYDHMICSTPVYPEASLLTGDRYFGYGLGLQSICIGNPDYWMNVFMSPSTITPSVETT
jgi:hypothetical protein